MIITIVLVLLSLILFFITLLYVKSKNTKKDIKELSEKSKNIKNITDIWGIQSIKNSILTCNNKHSIIIELGNIDYNLLNENEQRNIDVVLTNISKSFKYSSQFFSTTQKVDTTAVIENIYKNIENNKNEKMYLYGQKIIEYLEEFMSEKNLYVRKNYLLVSMYGDIEKVERELKNCYEGLRFNLLNIKIQSKLLNETQIIELLHRELNKNTDDVVNTIIQRGGLELYVIGKNEKQREEG